MASTFMHAYPAASTVAPQLHSHFARHRQEFLKHRSEPVAPLPEVDAIAAVIDAAFWASLRREEGYVPKISVAMVAQDQVARPMIFERPIALEPALLAKIAPAVERPGIHLGAWDRGDGVSVWGTVSIIPPLCLVLEVTAPGLLVVKHHRGEESGKFVNVAVLEGDRIKMVDENASTLPDCPKLVNSLLGFEAPSSWVESVNVLVQLAVSMRAHGRGGSLLVVPAGSETWRESIVPPLLYAATPPFAELADLNRVGAEERRERWWQDELARTVAAIAGLTAVDGATILTVEYALLGFGGKITRRKGWPLVERVTVTEPIVGGVAADVEPAQLGGTRHLSAAQFVQDQRDAIALVASQDGRFTIFAWSPCEERVHAHRVETLLL
jgi:Probable sensor domain DACNV